MPFVLTIAEGKGRGQQFSFETVDVTIGRGAENDVVLNDAGVSRNHARIQQQAAGFVLLDNGSSNGTELNGDVIERPQALRAGDRIGVGPVVFEFAPQAAAGETRITSLPRAQEQATRVSAMPEAPKAVAPRAGGTVKPTPVELFARLPLGARIGAGAVAALLVIGLARLAVSGRESKGLACPETISVDEDVSSLSFGHGEVDSDCGNKAVFGFNVPSNTRALFHYQPTHISSPSEVELRLNGKHLAYAPVSGARGEVQTVPLTPALLSADGRNFVTVVQSQKGKEWSLSHVRVDYIAVTPGDLKAARESYDRGRRKLEERRVAPRNLYDARTMFLAARRNMEGLNPRPALYDEVAQLIKDCERDLEKDCSRMLFTAARFEKYEQEERAQQTYREVLLHFPGDEPSGCRKKAQGSIISAQAEASE
jgi:hypothetical protein